MFEPNFVLHDDGNFHQNRSDFLDSLELTRERASLQDPIWLDEDLEDEDFTPSPVLLHECNDCGILIPHDMELCAECERWYEDRA